MNDRPLMVFSTSQDVGFASHVAQAAKVELGNSESKRFSDGEIWSKYKDNIRGADVYIVGATNPPADNLMEILIMIDAAVRASAGRITAVIPYFGYARQDRKDQPRVAITAKLAATMLEAAAGKTPFRVITMELHASQIQGFFNVPVDHLYASKVFIERLKQENLQNLTVVSPDVGGVKRARAYARRLDETGAIGIAVIDKRRPTQNQAEVMNIIGDVDGKNLLIVDDMIDTADSLMKACDALAKAGGREMYVCVTHAVLSGTAVARIEQSQVDRVFITNTLPSRTNLPRIEEVDVSPVFGEAIVNSHNNLSVSGLFLENKN